MTVILLLSFIQLSFSPQFLPPPTPIQDLIYPESTAAPIDSQIVQAVKCWVHNQVRCSMLVGETVICCSK